MTLAKNICLTKQNAMIKIIKYMEGYFYLVIYWLPLVNYNKIWKISNI